MPYLLPIEGSEKQLALMFDSQGGVLGLFSWETPISEKPSRNPVEKGPIGKGVRILGE
jgi:hypothetical protein